jgi:O-antigen ligase
VGFKGKDPKKAASHNTPVTVAAETGILGLALFAWLVVALFALAFRRRRRAIPLIAGLGIAAVLCHSLFYNAFFEDPMTWALFGLVALVIPETVRPAGMPARARREEPVPA